jgi:hypothetical protein
VKRTIALALTTLLTALGGDFAILNLRVIEGEGMVYQTGSRATRGITVLVTDETGRPVPDATVSFLLPEDGPSGVFASGSHTEIVTTKQDGTASVWGMRWNHSPGAVQVRITVAKDGTRAGIISTQHLTDKMVSGQGPVSNVARGGHGKLLWIALIAAGAAGAGLAGGMLHGRTSSETPATVPVAIGTPTVIVGGPQ